MILPKWQKVEKCGKRQISIDLPRPQQSTGIIALFRGEYHNHLDDKGRVSIPARLREQIASQHEMPLVVTRGFDKCLAVYPMDTWRKIEEKLSSLNTLNEHVRLFQRTLMKETSECEPDKLGRIVLSPVLREAAGITRDVVVVGLLNRIEIWDKNEYSQYHGQTQYSLESLAQKLSDSNLIDGLPL